MGTDCFDGGVLHSNEQLKDKVISEITEALILVSLHLFTGRKTRTAAENPVKGTSQT
jgi:hypothetical protein